MQQHRMRLINFTQTATLLVLKGNLQQCLIRSIGYGMFWYS